MNENHLPNEEPMDESAEEMFSPTPDSPDTEPVTEGQELPTAEEETPREAEEVPQEAQAPAEPVIYRWSYETQQRVDTAARTADSRRGVRNYAIVMTVCFLISLSLLFATLLVGWGGALLGISGGSTGGYREVFIRDGVDSDALTMQEISSAGNQVVVAISVKTATGSGVGSGIIMSDDGYIATNSHVVHGATEIVVRLYDGTTFSGTLIGESEQDDLAVIKIRATGLPTAKFGRSSDALVGDRVVVIGHPAGLEFGWTSTYGRLSAINRDVKIRDNDGTLTKKMTLLQTDANVNSGNSGGPIFNDHGEVIGIITLKLAGDYEGLGFAIPIDAAMPLLEALKEKGTTDGVQSGVSSGRPQLGITSVMVEKDMYYVLMDGYIQGMSAETAAVTEGSFQAEATGLLVTDVLESSDAYRHLQKMDIMTAIDGQTITSFEVMREHLYDCNIGDTVTIEYMRNGEAGPASVVLGVAE